MNGKWHLTLIQDEIGSPWENADNLNFMQEGALPHLLLSMLNAPAMRRSRMMGHHAHMSGQLGI